MHKQNRRNFSVVCFMLVFVGCAENLSFTSSLESNEVETNPGTPMEEAPKEIPVELPMSPTPPPLKKGLMQTWENQVKINELRMVLVTDTSGSMDDDIGYVRTGFLGAMTELAPMFKNICVGVMGGMYSGAMRGMLVTDPTVNDACLCTKENYSAAQLTDALLKNLNYVRQASGLDQNTEAVGFAAYKSISDPAALAYNKTAGGGGCGKSDTNDVAYVYSVFTDEAYLNARSDGTYKFEAGSEGNTTKPDSFETQAKALYLSEKLATGEYKLAYNENMLVSAYQSYKGINPGALYAYTLHPPFTATSQEEANPELANAAKAVTGASGDRDLTLARVNAAEFTKQTKDTIVEYATKKSGYREVFDLTLPEGCQIENLKVFVDDADKTDKIEVMTPTRFRIKAPDHIGAKVKAVYDQKAGSTC